MNKYWEHFKTITKHIHYVRKFCFKCGYFKRGLLHDISKYNPIEFKSSAKYYTGTRSPIDAEKDVKGYSLAWQHHKGHNPHHWEYWIDNIGTYKNTPIKIPYEYVIEMICDWLAAGIVYNKTKVNLDDAYKTPLDYYNKCKKERIFHIKTQELIESYLYIIAEYGINTFCNIVKYSHKIKKVYEESTI